MVLIFGTLSKVVMAKADPAPPRRCVGDVFVKGYVISPKDYVVILK
jgi:hypothetical protein